MLVAPILTPPTVTKSRRPFGANSEATITLPSVQTPIFVVGASPARSARGTTRGPKRRAISAAYGALSPRWTAFLICHIFLVRTKYPRSRAVARSSRKRRPTAVNGTSTSSCVPSSSFQ